MNTQSSHWWTTAFHVEWILLFAILSLGWFVVTPDNLGSRPILAIYALFVATATYAVVRLMHHGWAKHEYRR